MAAHGKVASARVVKRVSEARGTASIVEFTTDRGRHVRVKAQEVDEEPGATVPVRYLPDDPTHNVEREDSHDNAWDAGRPTFVTIVMAVLTLGLATGRLAIDGKRIVRTRTGMSPAR